MFSNYDLVENLIKFRYLRSEKIIDAFKSIDRIKFVPESLKRRAYVNEPLLIGFGQTISQPLTVAFMLELLDPQPGENILEIGAGSGWQTAMLAHIVGRKVSPVAGSGASKKGKKKAEPPQRAKPGMVVAIERISQLKEMAVRNVSEYNFVSTGIAKILLGDGSRGYQTEAPFDKVIAAAAGNFIPIPWKEQVKPGGRIVVPVGDSIKVLDKISAIDYKIREYSGFKFVPLVTNNEGGDGF